jgi:glycosyltransferase involved in cell wall biosynthesis
MKKVLIIGPLPPPINGCAFANKALFEYYKKDNANYAFIDTSTKEISSIQGDTFSIRKALSFSFKFFQVYKIFSYEIVYFTPGLTFYGVLKYAPYIFLSQILKKKYIIHIHGNNFDTNYFYLSKIKKKLFYCLISKAAHGIVLSESLVKNLTPFLAKEKISVVKNFIPIDLIDQALCPKPVDMLRIVFLSNLIIEKGFVDVLDALYILKVKGVKFEAIFAGKIDVEIFEKTKNKFDRLNGYVSYMGVVEGSVKKNILKQSNVFLLPTYYKIEGQPISILEAMATGNIIVTTRHGGIEDVINLENGFFVDKESPKSIASTLENISKNLSKEVENKSLLNFKTAIALYTEEKYIENLQKIFEKYENS